MRTPTQLMILKLMAEEAPQTAWATAYATLADSLPPGRVALLQAQAQEICDMHRDMDRRMKQLRQAGKDTED